MNYIQINNQILPADKALISVKERGFLFGDGVFETCRICNGQIYNWSAHFQRLKAGLKAIKININANSNIENLQFSANQLIAKNNLKAGMVRIYVSRGVGSIGYLPYPANIKPLIVIETKLLPKLPKTPISLWVSKITKPAISSLPVNYKLAQGLNSILAKIEATENDCFDSIILNDSQEVTETSSANIFWIKDNILYTPDQNCGLLLGTIRQKIIELSPLQTVFTKASLVDLISGEEIFLTNAAFGVLAVNKIMPDNKSFSINKYSKIYADLLNKDIEFYVKKKS